jgi:hypothetical protein
MSATLSQRIQNTWDELNNQLDELDKADVIVEEEFLRLQVRLDRIKRDQTAVRDILRSHIPVMKKATLIKK